MILTKDEIKKQVQNKRIYINPFVEKLVNPNSYTYRLGKIIYEVVSNPIDSLKRTDVVMHKMINKGYLLKPGKLYLGHTYEEIGSDYFVVSLIGRSSIGRLGLFMQITADLGHLGAKHCWTLEMKVVQPLRIYPLMGIGQVSFWVPQGNKKNQYNGRYNKYSKPHGSDLYLELGDRE